MSAGVRKRTLLGQAVFSGPPEDLKTSQGVFCPGVCSVVWGGPLLKGGLCVCLSLHWTSDPSSLAPMRLLTRAWILANENNKNKIRKNFIGLDSLILNL